MECVEHSSLDVLQRYLGEQSFGSKIFVTFCGGVLPRASVWGFELPDCFGSFCSISCGLVCPRYLLLQESYSVVVTIY